MSTKYKPEFAGPAEDSALRAILRNTFMPGKIGLSFQREPSFFLAEQAGNLGSQVITIKEKENGTIVGFGCRSFRQAYIDGQVSTIGYLSGLRCLPEFRGGTLLARAYAYLKELHSDGKVPYYITTIMDDNKQAKALLESGRAGLPTYLPQGQLRTFALPLFGNKRKVSKNAVNVKTNDLSGSAVECLNTFNSQYQYSPFYSGADLQGKTDLLPCFDENNFYAIVRGSKVIATAGVWDQNSFKQTVVANYSFPYQLIRPFTNLGAKLGRNAKLPKIGGQLPYLYASFLSHAPEHGEDLLSLIREIMADWSGRGYAYLLAGIHDQNPLANQLQQLAAMVLTSTVYTVYWEDLLTNALPTSTLIPHLEIATL